MLWTYYIIIVIEFKSGCKIFMSCSLLSLNQLKSTEKFSI
jgi:hypothetical protein